VAAEEPERALARSDARATCDCRSSRATARGPRAVDDIKREDSPTHVLAAYDVADGKPGVRALET